MDTWFLAGTILSVLFVTYLYRQSKRYRLPPGPRGLPIVGNFFDIPSHCEWEAYDRWSKQYGMCSHNVLGSRLTPVVGSDVIHLRLFGTDIIVLNSAKATKDLLEKRSAIYSDRYALSLSVLMSEAGCWLGRLLESLC